MEIREQNGWRVEYSKHTDAGRIWHQREHDGEVDVELLIQFQHGPVAEHGYNGIQNEEMLALLLLRLQVLNERLPCEENDRARVHLEAAGEWLRKRTERRIEQGVEGTEAPHGVR